MTEESPEPMSGWMFVAPAVLLGLFGALVFAGEDGGPPRELGIVIFAVAGLLASIGTVAVGVTMGLRRADYLRRR